MKKQREFIILDLQNNAIILDSVKLEPEEDLGDYIEEILPSNNCLWMEIDENTRIINKLNYELG